MTFEEWWDEVGHNMWCDNDDVFLSDLVKAAWEEAMKQVNVADNQTLDALKHEGYVLVPVEPTKAMIEAGEECEYFEGGYGSTCDEFWEVMVQAAQEGER